jgi:hypothetical protein
MVAYTPDFAGAAAFLITGAVFFAGGMTISLGRFVRANLLTPIGFEQSVIAPG